MLAVFIQGPGPELRFLAIRPDLAHAEALLRTFAEEIAREDPHREVNAFIVPCGYFHLHGGQAAPAEPMSASFASDLHWPVLDRAAAAETARLEQGAPSLLDLRERFKGSRDER